MARRRNTSVVDDIFTLVAKLPWWAGVVLAAVSYWLLHGVAAQPSTMDMTPGQLGHSVVKAVWRSMAGALQYLVPAICLAAAGASAWQRRARKQLVNQVTDSPTADALNGMSWRDFERLVGEGFRLQGFQVQELGGGGADGGVDLVLTRPGPAGGEKHLVQCKQWRAQRVGVDVVRELYGVMADRGAAGGFVVTSGRFTDEAMHFANGRNINLIDGPKLHALIRQARAGQTQRPTPSAPSKPMAPPPATRRPPPTPPACPVCAKPMVLRTAKRGTQAGGQFWGCTSYPACRGTRPTD